MLSYDSGGGLLELTRKSFGSESTWYRFEDVELVILTKVEVAEAKMYSHISDVKFEAIKNA